MFQTGGGGVSTWDKGIDSKFNAIGMEVQRQGCVDVNCRGRVMERTGLSVVITEPAY